jgi:GrpB-like predicted nucleotidyltransferase (UPF0157 family)
MKTFIASDVSAAVAAIQAALGDLFKRAEQVGSSYINSSGQGEDLDIVVLCADPGATLPLKMRMEEAGYRATGGESGEDDEFTTVCKALHLRYKWERVAVHRVLMNDEDAETAREVAQDKYGLEL